MSREDLARQVKNRRKIVLNGRDSGFSNIPDPLPGTVGNLLRPASGMIEDMQAIDAPGVRRIIAETGKTAPDKPLFICVGGPLTAVASAWLMDNSIADNIIVAWLSKSKDGMMGFNGWSDSWTAYIVLEKLRLVQFTSQSKPFSHVPRHRLNELPESEARDYMLTLDPVIIAPEGDADGPPAISVMRSDYVKRAKRASFGGWSIRDGDTFPLFTDDPDGQTVVVTEADSEVATEEWWRAMRTPAAWGHRPSKIYNSINAEDTLIQ